MTENCEERLVGTLFDFRHTNMTENLDAKWKSPLSLTNLWSISKVKVLSFPMGLTLMFLLMASYILTWDSKGLLLNPPPYKLRPEVVPTSTAAAEVSSEKNSIDMKLLAKIIGSKLEYTPRKVPDVKDIVATDSQLFSAIPRRFLPGIKSPCWYEEFSGELSIDPYKGNLLNGFVNSPLRNKLRTNFHQRLYHRGGKLFRLRCLPFFYTIGQPKCGTTDLFHRLQLHPQIKFNVVKEPHWWTRRRFGFKSVSKEKVPVKDFLDLFDWTAQNIQEGIKAQSTLITGEASPSTMWDNQGLSYLDKDREDTEPVFLTLDYIHAIQPDAKIIILLRDPVERLYSDYLYFTKANKSAEDFHQKVLQSVQLFQSCLSERSLRSCSYSYSLINAMPTRLILGMYVIFLLDWLTVFRREQILIVRLEDYTVNLKVTLKNILSFLTVGPMSEQVEAALIKQPKSNTRHRADRKLGSMLPATRGLLREFYQPFNHKLASVLENEAFLWSST